MLQQLEQQLGYTVLVRDLVYAEVEQDPQSASAPAAAQPARKRAKVSDGSSALTCAEVATGRGGLQAVFSGFNVIAVRNDLLHTSASRTMHLAAHAEDSTELHSYDARVHDGAQIAERRMLSSALFSLSGAAADAASVPPLRVYCTHLHSQHGAAGLNLRYAEATVIQQQLQRDSEQRAASVLCGDLNALSEWDYTPGEQHMLLAFSGVAAEAELNPWGTLELLEQHATDCFALAQQQRPKISCWACTRVDHILLNTRAAHAWRVQRAASYYTLASDHLPVVCWLRASL